MTVHKKTNSKQEKACRYNIKVVRVDWWLWRVIAMAWPITELAKRERVRVITSRPLVFWWNPYVEEVHGTSEVDLFKNVIKGNDYIELEPYTDPEFYNEGRNWIEVACKQLGLWTDKETIEASQPCLYLAEHENYNNNLSWRVVLFQPFGSWMEFTWADKTYRSFKIEDAQYIADRLIDAWYIVYEVFDKEKQPKLKWCVECSNKNLRWIISLADKYPVIGCDSCMHHAAKAFGRRSVVMWAATDAKRYGYDTSINMCENWMIEHTPMRFWTLWFNYDIINQFSNKFSKQFLDRFVEESKKLLQERYK